MASLFGRDVTITRVHHAAPVTARNRATPNAMTIERKARGYARAASSSALDTFDHRFISVDRCNGRARVRRVEKRRGSAVQEVQLVQGPVQEQDHEPIAPFEPPEPLLQSFRNRRSERRVLRRDLAGEKRDDLALLVDQVLAEVPRRQLARLAQ